MSDEPVAPDGHCSGCKKRKPIEAFFRNGKYRKTCNHCASLDHRRHIDRLKKKGVHKVGEKWCSSCHKHHKERDFVGPSGTVVLKTCYRCRGHKAPAVVVKEEMKKEDAPMIIPSTGISWAAIRFEWCAAYSTQALGIDFPCHYH